MRGIWLSWFVSPEGTYAKKNIGLKIRVKFDLVVSEYTLMICRGKAVFTSSMQGSHKVGSCKALPDLEIASQMMQPEFRLDWLSWFGVQYVQYANPRFLWGLACLVSLLGGLCNPLYNWAWKNVSRNYNYACHASYHGRQGFVSCMEMLLSSPEHPCTIQANVTIKGELSKACRNCWRSEWQWWADYNSLSK